MAASFIGEYEKGLRILSYDCEAEAIGEAYAWFQDMLRKAIENGMIDKDDVGEDIFEKLKMSLYHPKEYALKLKKNDRKENDALQEIIDGAKECGAVIFGAGTYGMETLRHLDRDHVVVKAFADNNEKLMGTKLLGIPVCSLKACLEAYPQELYVIASKYHAEEMKQQYMAEGGKEKQLKIVFNA